MERLVGDSEGRSARRSNAGDLFHRHRSSAERVRRGATVGHGKRFVALSTFVCCSVSGDLHLVFGSESSPNACGTYVKDE